VDDIAPKNVKLVATPTFPIDWILPRRIRATMVSCIERKEARKGEDQARPKGRSPEVGRQLAREHPEVNADGQTKRVVMHWVIAGIMIASLIAAWILIFRVAMRNHNLTNGKDTPDSSYGAGGDVGGFGGH
jgi:hypothetical protein